jgi:large subunit ribosomal protein L29
MKITELRSKSKEELKDVILSSKKELFNLRMQAATGASEGQSGVRKARRTIARVKTLLNETPKAANKAAPKKVAAKKPAAKTKKD